MSYTLTTSNKTQSQPTRHLHSSYINRNKNMTWSYIHLAEITSWKMNHKQVHIFYISSTFHSHLVHVLVNFNARLFYTTPALYRLHFMTSSMTILNYNVKHHLMSTWNQHRTHNHLLLANAITKWKQEKSDKSYYSWSYLQHVHVKISHKTLYVSSVL